MLIKALAVQGQATFNPFGLGWEDCCTRIRSKYAMDFQKNGPIPGIGQPISRFDENELACDVMPDETSIELKTRPVIIVFRTHQSDVKARIGEHPLHDLGCP